MRLSETTSDYCLRHGRQAFFLGEVFSGGECLGEAIHCPLCFPKHPDNPAVLARDEARLLKECTSAMHL